MMKAILIFFIIIRIFSNPIANVFQKKLSNEYSSITINFYTYLILSILCLFRMDLLCSYNYSIDFITLVITCGFLCTAGMLCMIKAVSIGELSVLGPINSYKSVISLIIAMILLKEFPNIQGIIGMLLIILGSKYIFIDDKNNFKLSILKRKDIQLRFLAMTLTAIEAVFLKQIILMSSVELCFIFWCFMGLFWNILILLTNKRQIRINERKSFFFIFIIAICLGLMQYSTNYVFKIMPVGFALSVFQLSSIVTVIFGWKIFKELNIKSKIIGCIIMIIGSCLILLN